MQKSKFVLFTGGCVLAICLNVLAQNQNRIYGKITTVDGDEFVGLIRWDKNEASWVDILNGSKEISRERIREARKKYRELQRERDDSFLGIHFGRRRPSRDWSDASLSGIRFGHIQILEPTGSNRALLTLKSGAQVEFINGSTDIGNDIRGIVIEDENEGEIEFDWRDIERVDFMKTKSGQHSNFGQALYGVLTTRHGDEFTGLICWDVDEVFTTDILDGSERGRKRKIKFADIEWIERYSSRGAALKLNSGREIVLRGSNDVDRGNRGILVADPGFGQVRVRWNDFKRLVFQSINADFTFHDFDGGKRLYGTVYTEDDDSYTGKIRWDNDEEYTWELLDGEYDDMEFDVEFGKIKSIEKESSRAALVTITDGRQFKLRGSNDVTDGNRGIFIEMANGGLVVVDWDDLDRVVFE
ncbi:MAG: hypothetical protein ACE5I1_08315, partial [bacterium]